MRRSLCQSLVAALMVTNAGACGSSSGRGTTAASSGSATASSASSAASTGAGGTGGHAGASASSSSGAGGAGTGGAGMGGAPSGWTLVWSDEFDGPDGTAVDPTKWTSLVGGDGWGNQEREYYTSDPLNAHQAGGNLVITATTEGVAGLSCWYGACSYTSARLQTAGLFEQAYGRFEARIQIQAGQGLWPAFWMLGNNIGQAGWPTCGEIDIMENIGKEPGTVHGSMHGPGYSGGSALTASYALPGTARFADGFHVFAVEWETNVVRFYVDETLYETRTPADVPAGDTWVYDHPFFMLLNVAVGGGWPGDPDGTTMFPQTMLVDYVRVYQHS